MKILAIDAGNTRIKWGVHDGAAWMRQGAVPTAESERLRDALEPRRERVVIANVAGERVREALDRGAAGRRRAVLGREPRASSAACAAAMPSRRSSGPTAGPR